jgi:protein-glutamine gamma-glutamyltransferase
MSAAAPRITRGRELDFEYQTAEDRGLRYRVFGPQPGSTVRERLLPSDRARYLSLPDALPERVRGLASEWAGGANDHFEIAKRIETHLRQDYRYSLESPSGAALNPLDHFLFESREGHCEFYSTSMAILLRTLGIPTRNVTGFVGGTFNRFGDFYAVRQGDAHSWVEVFIERAGWLRFDPTPATESAPRVATQGLGAFLRDVLEAATERWDRNVVGYDLNQQVHMLSKVRSQVRKTGLEKLLEPKVVGLTLVALLLGGVAFRFRHLWRRSGQPKSAPVANQTNRGAEEVVRLYRELEGALQVHGVPRRPETPPLAHALGLKALEHPLADDVLDLTRLYLAVRFGRAPFSAEQASTFQQRVKQIRQLPPPKAA